MRQQSQDMQKNNPDWIDLNQEAVVKALNESGATCLIHGHTHAPRRHDLGLNASGHSLSREVLSDWDLDAHQPRAEVFSLTIEPRPTGPQVQRTRQAWLSVAPSQ
jgi:UDP-2,3-diacylglucosamine hydrolase